MPHFPKPFYRKPRCRWYVEIRGKQINLGPDRVGAFQKCHELMASPEAPVLPSPELIEQFLPRFVIGSWTGCKSTAPN